MNSSLPDGKLREKWEIYFFGSNLTAGLLHCRNVYGDYVDSDGDEVKLDSMLKVKYTVVSALSIQGSKVYRVTPERGNSHIWLQYLFV